MNESEALFKKPTLNIAQRGNNGSDRGAHFSSYSGSFFYS